MGSNDDGGNAVARGHELLIHLQPGHAGHAHVSYDTGRIISTRRIEETLGVFERGGKKARRLQQILRRIPDRLVVVHDGDERSSRHFGSRSYGTKDYTVSRFPPI